MKKSIPEIKHFQESADTLYVRILIGDFGLVCLKYDYGRNLISTNTITLLGRREFDTDTKRIKGAQCA